MFRVDGKHALITGGTSGIGLATARRFVEAGAKVVVLGRRAEGEQIAAGIGAHFIRCDVSEGAALEAAFDESVARFGPLDVVVNNAGADTNGRSIADADADDFRWILEVNLISVYNALRLAPVRMNGGSIVNVSSLSAAVGLAGFSRYGATKAAVNNLTKNAAVELGPLGIRVNAVCPGVVSTPMTTGGSGTQLATVASVLGRIAQPEEIAGLVHFLATDEAGYITGQSIYADGGVTAGFSIAAATAIVSSAGSGATS